MRRLIQGGCFALVVLLVGSSLTLISCGRRELAAQAPAEESYAAEMRRAHASLDAQGGTGRVPGSPVVEEADLGEARAGTMQKTSHAAAKKGAGTLDDDDLLPASVEAAFEREPVRPSVEATLLRQDLADRAARQRLGAGDANAALSWTQRGLAVDPSPSVVRANLLITQADALVALGREDESRRPLMDALEVNQKLLAHELSNP